MALFITNIIILTIVSYQDCCSILLIVCCGAKLLLLYSIFSTSSETIIILVVLNPHCHYLQYNMEVADNVIPGLLPYSPNLLLQHIILTTPSTPPPVNVLSILQSQ